MIRISSQQIFSGGVNRLQELNVALNKTQNQISTGKRVINPSDDPVAAARILKLDQSVARIDTYQRNVSLAENRLQLEESTLASMVDVIQGVRELTVQAGNGSLSANDRQAIAKELEERLGQMASLANTRDSSGQHIFSGFQGNAPAFVQNVSGDWIYQGDEGQRSLEVDDGVTVKISDNGKKLFVDVPAAGPTFFTEASRNNTSGARISSGMVLDPDLLADLLPEDLLIEFGDDGAGGLTYEISERSTGNLVVPPTPYSNGDSIRVAGMQFEVFGAQPGDDFLIKTSEKQSLFGSVEKLIYGLQNVDKMSQSARVTGFAPEDGDSLQINGVSFTFGAGDTLADLAAAINGSDDNALANVRAEVVAGELVLSSGLSDIRIDATGWTGDLAIGGARFDDIGITAGVVDPDRAATASFLSGQKVYDDLIAASLINLDNAQESIIRTQTEIGGRMNALESTGQFLEESALYAKDIRSQLQDLDYAEAISNLSFQSFVLEAAQLSFAQTSRLSLFDRL